MSPPEPRARAPGYDPHAREHPRSLVKRALILVLPLLAVGARRLRRRRRRRPDVTDRRDRRRDVTTADGRHRGDAARRHDPRPVDPRLSRRLDAARTSRSPTARSRTSRSPTCRSAENGAEDIAPPGVPELDDEQIDCLLDARSATSDRSTPTERDARLPRRSATSSLSDLMPGAELAADGPASTPSGSTPAACWCCPTRPCSAPLLAYYGGSPDLDRHRRAHYAAMAVKSAQGAEETRLARVRPGLRRARSASPTTTSRRRPPCSGTPARRRCGAGRSPTA